MARRPRRAIPTDAIPTRTCGSCGRRMAWRRRWADDWDDVRWCSAACRRRKVTEVDHRLEAALRDLLSRSVAVATDDAARAVGGDDWRDLVEPARRAARRLHAAGEVVVTQGGRAVDPSTATGGLQVRRP